MKEAERKRNEPVDDSQVIDDVFGYLQNEDDKDVKRDPAAFKDLPQKKRKKSEVMIGVPAAPEDNEDLSEFSFQKFAKTYFQGIVILPPSILKWYFRECEPSVQQEADQTLPAASLLQRRQIGQTSLALQIQYLILRPPSHCGSASSVSWVICPSLNTTQLWRKVEQRMLSSLIEIILFYRFHSDDVQDHGDAGQELQ